MAFLFLLSLCFCHLNSWLKKYLFVDFFLLSCSPAWRVSWICKLSLNIIVPLCKYTISCMVACSMLTHTSLSLCLFPLFCLFFSLGIIIDLFSIVPFFFSSIWNLTWFLCCGLDMQLSLPAAGDLCIDVLDAQHSGLLRDACIAKCWGHEWVTLPTSSYHMGKRMQGLVGGSRPEVSL